MKYAFVTGGAGGIAGAITLENDLDPEEDIEITANDVIFPNHNEATIIAKKTLNDNTEKISGNFQIIENGI